MAKQIVTIDNSENSGSDETYTEKTSSTLEEDRSLFHFYNNFNVSVTVTVTGSRAGDDAFDEGVELNSESLSAGGNAGFYVVSDPWEQVQITLSPSSNPGSGELSVYRMDDN